MNGLSEQARVDATKQAAAELEKARGVLTEARQAMTAFRVRTRIVDPTVDLGAQMTVMTALQGQLAEAQVALDTLRQALPRTSTIHVFSWWPGHERLPLAERSDLWEPAFAVLAANGADRDALLEFVPGDDPASSAASRPMACRPRCSSSATPGGREVSFIGGLSQRAGVSEEE